MLVCPMCHSRFLYGTYFCDECGHHLIDHDESHAPYTTLYLHIGRKVIPVEESDIILGRRGGETRSLFIDLADFDAVALGVSRRHARLKRQGGAYYLTDLQSANHTYLNDMRLPAGSSLRLQPGDCLRLGRLEIAVGLG